MRAGLEEHAFGGRGLGIGAEADPGLGQAKLDIVLAHQEERGVDARIVLDDQVDDGVLGRCAAHARDLGQGLAGQRLQGFVPESYEQHARVVAGEQAQVFPGVAVGLHFGHHARADLRILEARDHGVVAAGLDPWRQGHGQTGRAGSVGIHVGADIDAFAACHVDAGDRLRHLRPVALAGRLQVVGLDMRTGRAADGDGFLERLRKPVGLAAHVRDVAAAGFGGGPGQRDQFLAVGKKRRRIDQRSTDPERALRHRLADEILHPR